MNNIIQTSLEGLAIDRIAYSSGEVLWNKPQGLKFLKYIQSTGTLYIKTGVIGDIDLEFEGDFIATTQNDNCSNVFGYIIYYSGTANNQVRFHFGKSIPGVGSHVGGTDLGNNFIVNDTYKLEYKDRVFTVASNNETKTADYTSRNLTNEDLAECYLFARHDIDLNKNDVPTCYSKGRISYWKVWDKEGTLIRHFQPCIYKNKVGMWDVVEEKFYPNNGTGEFIAGPELPRVKPVEYIEATGTLFIKSNYLPNPNTSIIVEWEYTDIHERAIYGNTFAEDTDIRLKGFRCLGGENSYLNSTYIASGGNRELHSFALPTGKLLTEHKGNTFTYNGTTIASGSGTTFTPLMIAHDGYWDGTDESLIHRLDWFKGKIYSFKIKDGNVVVRDFIPCKYVEKPWEEEPEEKVGLWDKVSLKFFKSDGTDEFIAGELITN